MATAMEAKGHEVNRETLATRVRNRRRLGDLEAAADANFKKACGGDNSDDEDQKILDDDETRKKEGEERGRKGRKEEKKVKGLLGKRSRNDDDDDMDSDDGEEDLKKIMERNIKGSLGKDRKSMTPVQRKLSV